MNKIYVGTLSGTSVDAIDVVAAAFAQKRISIVGQHTQMLPPAAKQSITRLQNATVHVSELARLDTQLGAYFARAVNQLLIDVDLTPDQIGGIGMHGQTILHRPLSQPPFTIQLGDPNVVAVQTACTTVADFRRADIAAGGQGAPLSCAFHARFFAVPNRRRVIINIGGIANVTILTPHKPVTGFDCGPGNVLLDTWARRHIGQDYDQDGAWAARATGHDAMLLQALLEDEFLQQPPPKSACTSHFSAAWLDAKLSQQPNAKREPAVVQATLAEFTAMCIVASLREYAPDTQEAFVCGGGANNQDLMHRIGSKINARVATTASLGIPASWVEAVAFAWLAQQRLSGQSAHVPSVTGATKQLVLGAVYRPTV